MCKIAVLLLFLFSWPLAVQDAPRFEVDPSWPGTLPDGWINGQIGGVCVDAHDHIVNLFRDVLQTPRGVRAPQEKTLSSRKWLPRVTSSPGKSPQRRGRCGLGFLSAFEKRADGIGTFLAGVLA